jgi:hypothetical protein
MGKRTIIDATHATVVFSFHDNTAQNGTVVLGDITADVPNSASAVYKAKEVLTLSDILVNGAAFTGVTAGGVHVNAYAGDVTGNGSIDALDVATEFAVAQGTATGFAAYALLDPAIIGDVAGDISVDAGDVSDLAAYTAQLPTPMIPAIPTGLTMTPLGADPTLSLSGEGQGTRGDAVSVLLDDPHPAGSTGMTEAVLALAYDPSLLSVAPADITLGSLPSQGSGWNIHSVVDAATGHIGIELYSLTPITVSQAGSLVNIAFHVRSDAPAVPADGAAVQLVSMATVNGQQFTTQVDDAQGQYVLSQGVDRVAMRASAGPLSLARAALDRVFGGWAKEMDDFLALKPLRSGVRRFRHPA